MADQLSTIIGSAAGEIAGQFGVPELRQKKSEHTATVGQIVYQAEYEPIGKPFAPSDADLIWLPHEPQWQQLKTSRLNAGLRHFSLDLSYRNNYEITKETAIQMVDIGLSLGGTFVDFEELIWAVEGEFAPLK